MSDFLDALNRPGQYRPARGKKLQHDHVPADWQPGIDTSKGTITHRATTKPAEKAIDWSWILKDYGLDPDQFTVEEPVEVRSWDMNMGDGVIERAYYYKAKLVRQLLPPDDLAELITEIKKAKPKAPKKTTGKPVVVVFSWSDWQVGKRDGDGTKGVVARVQQAVENGLAYLADLRAMGYTIDRTFHVGMGDLVEGCTGFYPMQEYEVELDRRSQRRVVRRLLLHIVKSFSPEAPAHTLTGVGGNHGENRKDGKAFTTFADNDDVAVIEDIGDILAENPDAYRHWNVIVPEGELVTTFDIMGTIQAFTHGHVVKRPDAIHDWWTKNAWGRSPAGDAAILTYAHFHHLRIEERTAGRVLLGCPAMDHSTWFNHISGYHTQQGQLTYTIGEEGWGNPRLI